MSASSLHGHQQSSPNSRNSRDESKRDISSLCSNSNLDEDMSTCGTNTHNNTNINNINNTNTNKGNNNNNNSSSCKATKACEPLERRQCKLPTLPNIDAALVGCDVLSADTVAQLIMGKFDHLNLFDVVWIVDCRFPYEYNQGHVRGAVNVVHPQDMEKVFLNQCRCGSRVALIFHCEFSEIRGPKMARFLRERDRKIHGDRYFPHLFFPELYVMRGGYKHFFNSFPELCEPRSYLPMHAPTHTAQCKAAVALNKQAWKMCRREVQMRNYVDQGQIDRNEIASGNINKNHDHEHQNGDQVVTNADVKVETNNNIGTGGSYYNCVTVMNANQVHSHHTVLLNEATINPNLHFNQDQFGNELVTKFTDMEDAPCDQIDAITNKYLDVLTHSQCGSSKQSDSQIE
jgi:hypothetical protein